MKFFDMFSSVGGFGLELEFLDGFDCVGCCKIDEFAKKPYEPIYYTEGELYYYDIKIINPDDLPDIDYVISIIQYQFYFLDV